MNRPLHRITRARPKVSFSRAVYESGPSPKKGFIAALVGLLFAVGGSVYGAPRTSGLWWMPDVASKSGEQIDQLTYFIYYLTGGLFILTQRIAGRRHGDCGYGLPVWVHLSISGADRQTRPIRCETDQR